ncbi:MAG: hypothetical protein KBS44_01395 [Clostridiales bacterium]|nr:hypothetical protein [Candidatus Coliplasma equi]
MPVRIVALKALVAAFLAIVPASFFLPPVMELTILVLTERETVEVALENALLATLPAALEIPELPLE